MNEPLFMVLFILIPAVILVMALVAFLRGPGDKEESHDPKRDALLEEMPESEIPAAVGGAPVDAPPPKDRDRGDS